MPLDALRIASGVVACSGSRGWESGEGIQRPPVKAMAGRMDNRDRKARRATTAPKVRNQRRSARPHGPPGEITRAQLESAIAGTAANTNPVATLDIPISDPPTQSEVQQILAKINELIVALRRPFL